MRLYAIVTSDTGKPVTKGGQECITITINNEQRAILAQIEVHKDHTLTIKSNKATTIVNL
jgi:hypothetical protein